MSRNIIATASLLITAVLGVSHEALAADSFFPSRPTGVQLYTVDGILADYAVGKSSGTLTLITAPGKVHREFYIGYPMKINGYIIKCVLPPKAGKPANPVYCKDWPSNLVLGQSKVRITFWKTKAGSFEAEVSDQIDAFKQP